jgi:hypothetical protein
LAIILLFIAFRNLQDEDNTNESEHMRSVSDRGGRVSFTDPRRRVDSDVKNMKEMLRNGLDTQEQNSRWSISNASSDFNRQGLMGSTTKPV